jgi:hypothetical protein
VRELSEWRGGTEKWKEPKRQTNRQRQTDTDMVRKRHRQAETGRKTHRQTENDRDRGTRRQKEGKNQKTVGLGCGSVAGHLPSTWEVLGSVPRTAKGNNLGNEANLGGRGSVVLGSCAH